ncbi:MAG: hypothetical protein Q9208_006785 [Pyrenodesmia sp. 3 TL-2023]
MERCWDCILTSLRLLASSAGEHSVNYWITCLVQKVDGLDQFHAGRSMKLISETEGQINLDLLNGNSKQDKHEPDTAEKNGADIIDIRQHEPNESLADLLRSSLKGGTDGKSDACFPTLLLWNRQGLRLFEKITYDEGYYLTNTEIAILERHCKEIAANIEPDSIVIELGSG